MSHFHPSKIETLFYLFMFTVLFYSKEWEHLGNSRWLVFSLSVVNLRVEEIFREIFMVFELKIFSSLHLESFFGFLDFLNFRHFQNKIVFSETIKLIWIKKIQNPWHSGKHSKEKNHKICQKTCRTLIVLIFNCLIFLILIFLVLGLVLRRLKFGSSPGQFGSNIPWPLPSFPTATPTLFCALEFLPWSLSSNLKYPMKYHVMVSRF